MKEWKQCCSLSEQFLFQRDIWIEACPGGVFIHSDIICYLNCHNNCFCHRWPIEDGKSWTTIVKKRFYVIRVFSFLLYLLLLYGMSFHRCAQICLNVSKQCSTTPKTFSIGNASYWNFAISLHVSCMRCGVRVVKEIDSKSIGLCPHRFESCWQRDIFFEFKKIILCHCKLIQNFCFFFLNLIKIYYCWKPRK